jgi:hypothetical protein
VSTIATKQQHLRKLYNFLQTISKEILGSDNQSRIELINVQEATILKIREVEKEISLLTKKEVITNNG